MLPPAAGVPWRGARAREVGMGGRGGWAGAAVVLGLVWAAAACAPSATGRPASLRSHGDPDPSSAASASGLRADTSAWRGQSVAHAEELLEARFPGVLLIRLASGDISVRIRGGTSIMGSNEPLYVIDGMEISPGPGGALVGINPADIATIQVLKDVGSTALYGVRGANGVVVITTKRGR